MYSWYKDHYNSIQRRLLSSSCVWEIVLGVQKEYCVAKRVSQIKLINKFYKTYK